MAYIHTSVESVTLERSSLNTSKSPAGSIAPETGVPRVMGVAVARVLPWSSAGCAPAADKPATKPTRPQNKRRIAFRAKSLGKKERNSKELKVCLPILQDYARPAIRYAWTEKMDKPYLASTSIHQLGLEISTPSLIAKEFASSSEAKPGSVSTKNAFSMNPMGDVLSASMPLSDRNLSTIS